MTARARIVPTPYTFVPTALAQAAANADLLHGGPRLSHVGRYQLLDSLSGDVHGRVYDAWDPLLERGVTVKTLQFGLKMSARIAVDRQILRAARQSAPLRHGSIATVLDSGLSAHGVYLVSEHLSGQSLEHALYEGWRPGSTEAIKLGRRIADALAYAHRHGVTHGGLEPACIYLNSIGRPKVLNFGLVDALRESDVAELADVRLGSLAYRAPEQLVGGPAEQHSDIFALGSVLYELLSGRRAFSEDTPEQLLQAILGGPANPLASLCPDLPDALVRLVESAMSFEPGNRPASAADMASELSALAKSRHVAREVALSTPRSLASAKPKPNWSKCLDFAGRLLGLGSVKPVEGPALRLRPAPVAALKSPAQPVAVSTAVAETQSA